MFSVALAVTLAGTFLLGSMVLCAVPTFLAPAFPARDSLPESRRKNTDFLNTDCVFVGRGLHRLPTNAASPTGYSENYTFTASVTKAYPVPLRSPTSN